MAMSMGGGGGVKAEPNVTPMIDVMLVLLIIFMIIIPTLMQGAVATMPQGVNIKDHPAEDADQVLTIDVNGDYYLNNKPVQHTDLAGVLNGVYTQRIADQIDQILYIKADRDLPYVKILDAMDVAAQNKVRLAALVADQSAGTQSTVKGDIKNPDGEADPFGSGAGGTQ